MVGAVQSKKLLQRRVDYYLWKSSGLQATGFRDFYKKYLKDKRSAIIGGVLRDIAFVGTHRYKTFRSDIDVVIQRPIDEVDGLAKQVRADQNRFGGYSVVYKGVKIDFWALEKTWSAQQEQCLLENIYDVIHWTFFNLDSIIYILDNKEIVCADEYIDLIKQKTIDVIKRNNPEIRKNILKAFQRMYRLNIDFSKEFKKDIIEEHLTLELVQFLKSRCPKIDDYIYPSNQDGKFLMVRGKQLNLFDNEQLSLFRYVNKLID